MLVDTNKRPKFVSRMIIIRILFIPKRAIRRLGKFAGYFWEFRSQLDQRQNPMPRKNQIIYNIAIWILIVLAVSTTVINCVSIFYNTFSPPALTLEESKLINDPVREKLNNILREKQSRQYDQKRN